MRGLVSVILSHIPNTDEYRTGLIILSCTEKYDERIARRAQEWLPHIQWSIVKRFEPGFEWFEGDTIFSSYAPTLAGQARLIRRIRQERFDLTILSCTNEPSFNPLKIMGILSDYRSLVVFNENIDAYFACRDTRSIILKHFRWRLAQKKHLGSRNLALTFLSWIFLFPPAFLYILLRTLFLITAKQLRKA